MKDILTKDEPLIQQLNNGFQIQANLDILANFKKVAFEIL